MEKTKVMFINPPQSIDNKLKVNNLKFPLGFLYMGGYLEKNGFEVKILDCPLDYKKVRKINKEIVKRGLLPSEIKREIKEFNPDIVGVSCAYTAYESDSFEIIELIRNIEKEMNKKFLIVVGGAHTSANYSSVLKNKKIDLAVIGEGEETILEIVKKFSRKENLANIQGTAIRVKSKIKLNKTRPPITELDSLSPAWHLINMNDYFSHPDNSRATLRKPSVDLITSRGCPGNCIFCSIRTVWGRCWRGESPKKVADELEFLVKKYGVRQFRFQDDNMTLNKKRIISICDEIIKRKLNIKWDTPNGVAFWTLDEEVLKKMKKAGYYRITLGIESASKKTQEYIRKAVDLKKINEVISISHKLGFWVGATFIIGFPYEKLSDIKETSDFILNSGINFPFVYIAQPYAGTDLHKDFVKEHLISNIKYTSNVAKTQYDTINLSHEQLNKIRNNLVKKFYLKKIEAFTNPFTFHNQFLKKINTVEDAKYVFKVLSTLAFKS